MNSTHIRPSVKSRKKIHQKKSSDENVNKSSEDPREAISTSTTRPNTNNDELMQYTRQRIIQKVQVSPSTKQTSLSAEADNLGPTNATSCGDKAITINDDQATVELTKGIAAQSIQSKMASSNESTTIISPPNNPTENQGIQQRQHSKGILKHNPRYTNNTEKLSNGNKDLHHIKLQTDTLDDEIGSTAFPYNDKYGIKAAPLVQDTIQERINPVADVYPFHENNDDFTQSKSISNHTPSHTLNSEMNNLSIHAKNDDVHVDKPMIAVNGTDSVEAEMEFTCMTKEEYDDASKHAASLGIKVQDLIQDTSNRNDSNDRGDGSLGSNKIDSEYYEDSTLPETEVDDSPNDDGNDDGNDGFLLDLMEEDSEEEPESEYAPKSFLIIWNCLSAWITPESVALLQDWRRDLFSHSPTDITVKKDEISKMNDVCASRCSGLMTMLKLYQTKALIELGYSGSGRTCDTRLGTFIQCFDYSKPMVKLEGKLWKALCTVLLKIVLPTEECYQKSQDYIPPSIQSVDISLEEYTYLTARSIASLHHGSV